MDVFIAGWERIFIFARKCPFYAGLGDLAAVRYEEGCFKDVCKGDIASIENA